MLKRSKSRPEAKLLLPSPAKDKVSIHINCETPYYHRLKVVIINITFFMLMVIVGYLECLCLTTKVFKGARASGQ